MATINDYLNKVRQDRPEYFGYSDYRLYKELQDKDLVTEEELDFLIKKFTNSIGII